ncbi:MAG TPA: hypothetical protein VLM89_08885 [Phycisphaerae bacterium]|nr:hypothetical protein [Phycisphaerae bacterium]
MGFASGTVTFKRFAVQGKAPKAAGENLIECLSEHAIDADSVQTADRTVYGWITGEHLLDTRFDLAKNAVADGLFFGLRIDTNKPPADLVRSYCRMNEQAMLQAKGRDFLSKAERREAREKALAEADKEARKGVFRRMKQVPVFWDLKRGEVYLGGAGPSVVEHFMMLFQTTFDLSLAPLSAGELAARWAVRAGEGGAFDDCRPAFFIKPPEGAPDEEELINPAEGSSRDFLGTEWLTWLWYASHAESPTLTVGQGGSVTVLFEKSLQMQCAFNLSGSMSVLADSPTRLPETPVALAGGKRPVRAGLQISVRGDVFGLAVRGDAMNFSGVQLPPPAEDVIQPRAIFEDRMDHLRHLVNTMDDLYAAFLKRRLSSKWSQTLAAVRNWIAAGARSGDLPAGLSAAS